MGNPDCIIIGGGIMGTSIAWRLAQSGMKALLLERSLPGAEASTAAAGILAAQEEARGPGPLADLLVASRRQFPSLSEELRELSGLDIGYRRNGIWSVASTPEAHEKQRARYQWMLDKGDKVRWLSSEEMVRSQPAVGPEQCGGVYFENDAQLAPREYMKAIAIAAARSHVELRTGAQVQGIVIESGRVRGVRLTDEVIEADKVLVAAGSWSSLIHGLPQAKQKVRPVRGQMVCLETRVPLFQGVIVEPDGGYVVGRPDGTLLVGATVEEAGFDKSVTAGGLWDVLDLGLRLVPALSSARLVDSWANFRPTVDDGLPLLGSAGAEGLYWATGHYRHGILLSAITASLLSELIATGRCDYDLAPFAPGRTFA